jgi:hypothetical protein
MRLGRRNNNYNHDGGTHYYHNDSGADHNNHNHYNNYGSADDNHHYYDNNGSADYDSRTYYDYHDHGSANNDGSAIYTGAILLLNITRGGQCGVQIVRHGKSDWTIRILAIARRTLRAQRF